MRLVFNPCLIHTLFYSKNRSSPEQAADIRSTTAAPPPHTLRAADQTPGDACNPTDRPRMAPQVLTTLARFALAFAQALLSWAVKALICPTSTWPTARVANMARGRRLALSVFICTRGNQLSQDLYSWLQSWETLCVVRHEASNTAFWGAETDLNAHVS
ncbi:hypothetical protein BDV12DRAFT_177675 [Aspergillus spectabilis]